jgi:hypothetical protein
MTFCCLLVIKQGVLMTLIPKALLWSGYQMSLKGTCVAGLLPNAVVFRGDWVMSAN